MTSVARDPAQHHPSSSRRPPDFDAFWAETLAAAHAKALNATLTPEPFSSSGSVEVFEIAECGWTRPTLEPGEHEVVLAALRQLLAQPHQSH